MPIVNNKYGGGGFKAYHLYFFAIKELDTKYQGQEKCINDLEKQIEALENKLK